MSCDRVRLGAPIASRIEHPVRRGAPYAAYPDLRLNNHSDSPTIASAGIV